MKIKNKKAVIIACLAVIAVWCIIAFRPSSTEDKLLDELNTLRDPQRNIEKLLLTEKYDPDLYFCMGETVSEEVYIGYVQLKSGYVENGKEALYLPQKSLCFSDYRIMKKTPEEGAFVFGFVDEKDVEKVLINNEEAEVKYYSYSNGKTFGFWHKKVDYDFMVNDYKRISASANRSVVSLEPDMSEWVLSNENFVVVPEVDETISFHIEDKQKRTVFVCEKEWRKWDFKLLSIDAESNVKISTADMGDEYYRYNGETWVYNSESL